MKPEAYFIVYNEIDDTIYEGTPVWHNREDAVLWFHKNDGRPSSKVLKVTIKIKNDV